MRSHELVHSGGSNYETVDSHTYHHCLIEFLELSCELSLNHCMK
jgi:hypothetical protein